MNQPFEVPGVWWLPDTPTHKVAGWFTWDPADGGRLRLAGSLRRLNWIINERPDGHVQRYISDHVPYEEKIYPRIHGQSGSRYFTLENSFRLGIEHHLSSENDAAEKVHVNRFIEGACFGGPGEVEFDQCRIDLQYLTPWMVLSGLERDSLRDLEDRIFAAGRAKEHTPFRATVGDDCGLTIWQELSTDGDEQHELIFRQRWNLRLEYPKLRPVSDFVERFSDFRHLLTIAAGDTATIERVRFSHPDVPQLNLAGLPVGDGKIRADLEYYNRWANNGGDSKIRSQYEMLFTFEDLGGIEGVGRWMRFASEYRSELSRVMAMRYNAESYIEDRVVNCVAALESFDRVRRQTPKRPKVDLLTRLDECVRYAGKAFLVVLGGEDAYEWTRRAKDHRNALDHHDHRFRANVELVERGISDQLWWLAVLCFLRASDAPPAVFDAIAKHPDLTWIGTRAAARRRPQRS